MGNACVCPECPRQPCFSRGIVLLGASIGCLAAIGLMCLVGWACHKLGQRKGFQNGYRKGVDDEQRHQQAQKLASTRSAAEIANQLALAALRGGRLSIIEEEVGADNGGGGGRPGLQMLTDSPVHPAIQQAPTTPLQSPPIHRSSVGIGQQQQQEPPPMLPYGGHHIQVQPAASLLSGRGGRQHFKRSASGETFI